MEEKLQVLLATSRVLILSLESLERGCAEKEVTQMQIFCCYLLLYSSQQVQVGIWHYRLIPTDG